MLIIPIYRLQVIVRTGFCFTITIEDTYPMAFKIKKATGIVDEKSYVYSLSLLSLQAKENDRQTIKTLKAIPKESECV